MVGTGSLGLHVPNCHCFSLSVLAWEFGSYSGSVCEQHTIAKCKWVDHRIISYRRGETMLERVAQRCTRMSQKGTGAESPVVDCFF